MGCPGEDNSTQSHGTKANESFIRKYDAVASRLSRFAGLVVIASMSVFWSTSHRQEVVPSTQIKKVFPDCPQSQSTALVEGWIRPPVKYAHLHMAKTGGTTINGYLATHYERVCGNKGYAFDFFQYNHRVNNSQSKFVKQTGGKDLVSQDSTTHNRGKVNNNAILERGFEDCDYLSLEFSASKWIEYLHNWKLEIHVPCRDPVDHILSQCHHWRKSFSCQGNPKEEIEWCLLQLYRLDTQLLELPNFDFKCFDYQNLSEYMDYMGTILQPRLVTTDYVFRQTNLKRQKEKECLWANPRLMRRVRQIMVQDYAYYNFCDKCLGSSNDLLHPR